MLVFFKDRLASLGIDKGGLNNYYAERIAKGSVLGKFDFYLIEEIKKRYASGTFIHEMACGAAQLGHVLSFLGYKVIASECDNLRFKLAGELGEYLGSSCVVVKGDSFEIKTNARVYLTVNAVSSHVNIKNNIGYIRSKLTEGSDLMINADLYGTAKENTRGILKSNGIKFTELDYSFVFIDGQENVR